MNIGCVMFKFEMNLGWLGDGKMTIETHDFDMIEALKEFVEFQEEAGWIGNWDAVEVDEEGEEEEVAEEVTLTEEERIAQLEASSEKPEEENAEEEK